MTETMDARLGAFDAVMWGVESDPILRSVIVAVTVLDKEPDVDQVILRMEHMTRAVPKLRQRVIGNPVSLIPPRWEVDPNFDIGSHLRRYRVPSDGTLRPMLRIAEQMGETDFDRSRPLWELAVVTGFDGDRASIILKIHHAITDGVGGVAMAAALFDITRDSGDLGELPPAPAGEVLDPAGRVLAGVEFAAKAVINKGRDLAEGAVELGIRGLQDPAGAAGASVEFAQSMTRVLAPASEPLSEVMVGRSLSQRMEIITIPLAALKAASKANGGSLNDGFMAAVAGGMGRYHLAKGKPVPALRINMPVNMRAPGSADAGNAWVPARFAMPISEPDPGKRIKDLAPLLKEIRSEPALVLSNSIFRLMVALPQAVTTQVAAGMMKGTDIAATNVPGPPINVYTCGSEVQALVPFAPKAGASANIGLMSYAGTCYIGVNMDTRPIPDPDFFMQCLLEGFNEIAELGGGKASWLGMTEGTEVKPAAKKATAKKLPPMDTGAGKRARAAKRLS